MVDVTISRNAARGPQKDMNQNGGNTVRGQGTTESAGLERRNSKHIGSRHFKLHKSTKYLLSIYGTIPQHTSWTLVEQMHFDIPASTTVPQHIEGGVVQAQTLPHAAAAG